MNKRELEREVNIRKASLEVLQLCFRIRDYVDLWGGKMDEEEKITYREAKSVGMGHAFKMITGREGLSKKEIHL